MNIRFYLFLCSLLCAVWLCSFCAAVPADFQLTEYLGHTWQHEPVTFPLTAAQLRQTKAIHALCGQDGAAIPYQLVSTDTPLTPHRLPDGFTALRSARVSIHQCACEYGDRFEDYRVSGRHRTDQRTDRHPPRQSITCRARTCCRRAPAIGGVGDRLPTGDGYADHPL